MNGKRDPLVEIERVIAAELKSLRKASNSTWDSHVRIGEALSEAKKLVPHGHFDNWCWERFGLRKSQRCDLVRIFKYRYEIDEARRNTTSASELLTDMSISYALRLLKAEVQSTLKSSMRRNLSVQSKTGATHSSQKLLQPCSDSRTLVFANYEIWKREGLMSSTGCWAATILATEAARYDVSLSNFLAMYGLECPEHRNFASFRLARVPSKPPYRDGIAYKVMLTEAPLTRFL